MVVPLNIKHNMTGDSKHNKNQKITDLQPKLVQHHHQRNLNNHPYHVKEQLVNLVWPHLPQV